MNINMKKLSDYNATEGMQIISKLNRAITPYLKDKKLIKKVTDCMDKFDPENADESRILMMMGMVDIVANHASGLIFEVIAIISGTDKETIEQANVLDVIDALMILKDDVKFMGFLSKQFSLVQGE